MLSAQVAYAREEPEVELPHLEVVRIEVAWPKSFTPRDLPHDKPRPKADWDVLIQSARDGDAHAYRQLLKEISPFLRSMAAKVHRDPNDIEDAVQDALLSIHTVRHAHDVERPFAPWLVAIARRRFADRLRRQGRIRKHEVPLDVEHENVAECFVDSPAQSADATIIRDAVNKLPPAQREAITLTKLHEMSLDQAAQITGSSVAALKISTHRGLRSLRKLLGL